MDDTTKTNTYVPCKTLTNTEPWYFSFTNTCPGRIRTDPAARCDEVNFSTPFLFKSPAIFVYHFLRKHIGQSSDHLGKCRKS